MDKDLEQIVPISKDVHYTHGVPADHPHLEPRQDISEWNHQRGAVWLSVEYRQYRNVQPAVGVWSADWGTEDSVQFSVSESQVSGELSEELGCWRNR